MWPLSCEPYQHDGRRHAVHHEGNGSPLLLVHGSLSSHRVWRGVLAALPPGRRAIAPDLAGYGHSEALPATTSPLEADSALLVSLIDREHEPVDLVAHSYGGAAALLAARARPGGVRSLVLYEPVLFGYLRRAGDWTRFAEVAMLASRVADDHARGDDGRALSRFLAFWLPWWQRALLPARARRSLQRGVGRLVRDFQSMHQRYPPLEALSELPMPVTLVEGTRSPRPLRAVMDLAADACPRWRRLRLRGAGHFAPSTHAAALAERVDASLRDAAGISTRIAAPAPPPARRLATAS